MEKSVELIRRILPLIFLMCVNNVFSSTLIAAGKSMIISIITISCLVGIRQLYLFVMSNYVSNIYEAVTYGYPVGWLAQLICIIAVFLLTDFNKCSLVDEVE